MGIGTLSERNLHATLKRYCEEDESFHEVKYLGYVADILRDECIIEIQTRAFYRMKKKLQAFLSDKQVTVVYPVSHKKRLIWTDPETGEMQKPRLSPKTGTEHEIFYELPGLLDLLDHPNLRFRIILVDVDEYRLLDGWGRGGKRGSHRAERIPTAIVSDTLFASARDWAKMPPKELPMPFTVKEYAKACRISPLCASRAIKCLLHIDVIEQCGKKRNAYLYEKVELQ